MPVFQCNWSSKPRVFPEAIEDTLIKHTEYGANKLKLLASWWIVFRFRCGFSQKVGGINKMVGCSWFDHVHILGVAGVEFNHSTCWFSDFFDFVGQIPYTDSALYAKMQLDQWSCCRSSLFLFICPRNWDQSTGNSKPNQGVFLVKI